MQCFTLQIQRKYLTTVETMCKNKIGTIGKQRTAKITKWLHAEEKHKNYWQTAHSNSEYMMEYAQIERKPFPYFFVDVGCWECYSVDVKDAHQKISKTLHRLERRKQI